MVCFGTTIETRLDLPDIPLWSRSIQRRRVGANPSQQQPRFLGFDSQRKPSEIPILRDPEDLLSNGFTARPNILTLRDQRSGRPESPFGDGSGGDRLERIRDQSLERRDEHFPGHRARLVHASFQTRRTRAPSRRKRPHPGPHPHRGPPASRRRHTVACRLSRGRGKPKNLSRNRFNSHGGTETSTAWRSECGFAAEWVGRPTLPGRSCRANSCDACRLFSPDPTQPG